MTKGFGKMPPGRHREIAVLGGRSVPAAKRSFSQDHKLAAKAGAKGGANLPAGKRSFSTNRELAAEAGRKGGRAAQLKRREKQ